MRLFAAAELPNSIIDALAETSARLRDTLRGRYVAPDSFHVTLAFLGEVPVGRIDAVAEAFETGCQPYGAFDVSLGELGSFGKRTAATLWQGFDEQGDLPKMAEAIREELRVRGFSFDEKAFKAHVTLMRKADLAAGTLPTPATARGTIERVSLFCSDLSGSRPVYETLHTVCLR